MAPSKKQTRINTLETRLKTREKKAEDWRNLNRGVADVSKESGLPFYTAGGISLLADWNAWRAKRIRLALEKIREKRK